MEPLVDNIKQHPWNACWDKLAVTISYKDIRLVDEMIMTPIHFAFRNQVRGPVGIKIMTKLSKIEVGDDSR